jgi:hypothetical protein
MSDDTRRVLELVAQGRITVDDAAELLAALRTAANKSQSEATASPGEAAKPRYVRIAVHKPGREGRKDKDVNIRVPMSILRSGMRLGAIIPGFARDHISAHLREQGVDVDLTKLDPAVIEALLTDLGEVNIDVNHGNEQVRITCE